MGEQVIPLHVEKGMEVVAAFVDLDDEDAYVWVRRFAHEDERRAVLDAVHDDPRWRDGIGPAVRDLLAPGRPSTTRLVPVDTEVLP